MFPSGHVSGGTRPVRLWPPPSLWTPAIFWALVVAQAGYSGFEETWEVKYGMDIDSVLTEWVDWKPTESTTYSNTTLYN